MKLKKNNYLMLSAICMISFTASAKASFPLAQEGPEPPPGVFIDSWLPLMAIAGILIAALYFYKKSTQVSPVISEDVSANVSEEPNFLDQKKDSKIVSKTRNLTVLLLTLLALNAHGQVQNNGNIYVANNANFHIASGNFTFGNSPATTQTTKAASHGVLSFASAVTWSGASSSHYTDGYVRHYGTEKFLFPVGNAGIYAPVEATASDASGIDVAYFHANPNAVGVAVATELTGVSTVEYWHILPVVGAQAKISLTWSSSSAVGTLTGNNLNALSISGWNGTNWVEIESRVDNTSILGGTSSLTSGSITSITNVNLANFSAFTLGMRNSADCVLPAGTTNSKFWLAEGWSSNSSSYIPTTPPDYGSATNINVDYNGPSFFTNTLVIRNGSNLIINQGVTVEVLRGITAMGANIRVTVKNGGSFLRRTTGLIGTLTAIVEKTTRDMRLNDYIYWGSPMSGNVFSQIDGAIAQGESVAGAFDLKYKYASGPGGGWQTLTATTLGEGFITRVKNQAPFTQQGVVAGKIDMTLTGTQNTGNIIVPVKNNPSSPNGSTSYNLIANPYPSPIDLDKFLMENLDIDGAAYVWTSATDGGNSNNTNTQYAASDYAVYNLAGQVNTSPIAAEINGRIDIAQGFKVKSLVPTGSVTFNNCMRTSSVGVNFFRQSSEPQPNNKNSFKLNMTADGIYSEILIAYLADATMGYDRLYDAGRNSTSPSKLYSILETDGTKLAINSRPEFFSSDIVPLGVSKTGNEETTFVISITDKGGIFNNGTPVYLHDKALQLYHNFANGAYTFRTSETVSDNRFEIVYENVALSNPDFNVASALASIKNGQFNAKSMLGMVAIEIFDLMGRKIASFKGEGQTEVTQAFNHADGVYITKIKLSNGAVVTQKLMSEK